MKVIVHIILLDYEETPSRKEVITDRRAFPSARSTRHRDNPHRSGDPAMVWLASLLVSH